jgi:hypothetical protein
MAMNPRDKEMSYGKMCDLSDRIPQQLKKSPMATSYVASSSLPNSNSLRRGEIFHLLLTFRCWLTCLQAVIEHQSTTLLSGCLHTLGVRRTEAVDEHEDSYTTQFGALIYIFQIHRPILILFIYAGWWSEGCDIRASDTPIHLTYECWYQARWTVRPCLI